MSLDNLVIDLHNINITDNEVCMICREELSEAPVYKLPECGHQYHTHCIISWFRNGDSRCPYCGNKGINHKQSKNSRSSGYIWRRRAFYHRNEQGDLKLSELKKYSKKPEAPKLLFRQLKKLEDSKKNLSDCKEELKTFKDKLKSEALIYSEAQKEYRKLRSKKWQAESNVCRMRQIINELNIVPLIIPQPINLN